MVTVVPTMNRGASLVNALGQGAQNAMNNPILQQKYQRSQIKSGLTDALGNLSPEQQQQLGPLVSLFGALGGIPGTDRALASLAPLLLNSQIARNVEGQGDVPGQGQVSGQANLSNALNQINGRGQSQQQLTAPFRSDSQPKQQFAPKTNPGELSNVGSYADQVSPGESNDYESGGLFPRIRTPEEIEQISTQKYLASNGAVPKESYYNQLLKENQVREQNYDKAKDLAHQAGISDQEMPKFIELGRQFQGEKDLNKWLPKAVNRWRQYKSAVNLLQGAQTPQFLEPKHRKDILSRYGTGLRDMKRLGLEEEGRMYAAKDGLSPLEVETELNPASARLKMAVDKAPEGFFDRKRYEKDFEKLQDLKAKSAKAKGEKYERQKYNPYNVYNDLSQQFPEKLQKSNDELGKYIAENLTDEDSLLVFRDKLMKSRGYDWRQFAPAYEAAIQNGFVPTASQMRELGEFATVPPRNSMDYIFIDYSPSRRLEQQRGVQ
jgi:hypothetical protein